MHRLSLMIVFVLSALTLAGCGGAGNDQHTSQTSGSGTGLSGAVAAAAVGIPLADGADAVAVSETGPLKVVQYIVPLERQAATIAFYDQWTAAQADDYQRTEGETGGVSWQNAPAADGAKHIIAVLSPIEGDDFVAVTITAGSLE
jgi:hypothetical protein